jgi:acetyltransferase-like isoleucine patch superfamily enzyme
MSQLSFYERLIGKFYRKIYSPVFSLFLRRKGVVVGKGVIFYGHPSVQIAPGSKIYIGDECIICSHSTYTAMGVIRPVVLRTMQSGAVLHIGRNVGISGSVVCSATSIKIGEDCLLGSGCIIVDTDFHPVDPTDRRKAPLSSAKHKAVVIEENAFIGAGAYIGKGVCVGRNSIVGAMSVVTKDVPSRIVVAGNPATVLKRL